MNCPKCGGKLTPLLISYVCDHCDPPAGMHDNNQALRKSTDPYVVVWSEVLFHFQIHGKRQKHAMGMTECDLWKVKPSKVGALPYVVRRSLLLPGNTPNTAQVKEKHLEEVVPAAAIYTPESREQLQKRIKATAENELLLCSKGVANTLLYIRANGNIKIIDATTYKVWKKALLDALETEVFD